MWKYMYIGNAALSKLEKIFITVLESELYDPVSQILTKTRML